MISITLAANPYVYTLEVDGRRAAEKFAGNGKVLELCSFPATHLSASGGLPPENVVREYAACAFASYLRYWRNQERLGFKP